jgi:membrane protein YdbS with pleckstrin-like domain
MRYTEVAVVGGMLLALGVLLSLVGPLWATATVAGSMLVAVALALRFVHNRVRAWGYLERHDDLLVRRGVLLQRLSVVPYGRMQFVEVTAGLVERLYGLSTVQLHTAAARSDARIPGLGSDEAARLRDRLAALGEAQAAGM